MALVAIRKKICRKRRYFDEKKPDEGKRKFRLGNDRGIAIGTAADGGWYRNQMSLMKESLEVCSPLRP